MELTAIANALKAVPPTAAATVRTDCMWCTEITGPKGRKWREAGWRNRTGPRTRRVSHVPLAEQVLTLLETRPRCRVRWIKGHNGNRWNMRAHALAKQTVQPGADPPETRKQKAARRRARAKRLAALQTKAGR